ncbi:MAG TPA: FAD-dependent oxidoreductase, partial [Spirochaetota bacterium]|nr:FAD-dependent oxidoreductase [Spirochaetota bacterium]
YKPELKSKIGKKVAIVGGGPAGLSAAYYLVQEGVDVEIFEAKNILGGMLFFGIPQYRLPKDVLAKEVEIITSLGMKVHFNKIYGVDITAESLKKDGFDAIILAMGAWKASKLGIPNEEAENVLNGIKFLEKFALKEETNIYGKVAIVGGGNTAFDCARTALRLGAKEVTMIYRRTKEEMPANEVEIHEAEEEGIKFQLLTAPLEIVKHSNGKVKGLICQKMKLGDPDVTGRRTPMPITGSEFSEDYDFIIAAIGQGPDYNILGADKQILVKDGKRLSYTKGTFQTEIPDLFVAGDFATGAATVVEALGSGKKAALSALKYITGVKLEVKEEFFSVREDLKSIEHSFFKEFKKEKRERIAVLSPEKRKTNFNEIESVFPESQAAKEAARCMECGCMDVHQCLLKKYADDYNADETNYSGSMNVFKNDDGHPFIFREPSKCILCGRCIRLCDEKVGVGVYGYVKRGFDTIVNPSFNIPLADSDCVSCGTCISGCPVGAIVPKTPDKKKVAVKGRITETNCYHCSIACPTKVESLTDSIYEVNERMGYLCKKGKFNIPSIDMDFTSVDKNILANFKDATVYPSVSLSAEDYEALKIVAGKNNWSLANYYSQSSLWIAFADNKTLPAMDFFTNDISENTLVIVSGNLEKINPIAINKLNITMKNDTKIIQLNKESTIRVRNLGSTLVKTQKDIEKENLNSFKKVILLINPVDFDTIYGENASLNLYNYLAEKSSDLKTTLFSEGRNLYSFYDANILPKENSKKIYIQTKFDDKKLLSVVLTENGKEVYSFKLPISLQTKGTFLNSKNELYKNSSVFDKDDFALVNIFKQTFGIGEVNLNKISSTEKEKKLDVKASSLKGFPLDGFVLKFGKV